MVQNVVIRGKKANGAELPILVDADGKIEVVGVTVGDVTISSGVTVDGITNKINVAKTDEVTNTKNVESVDLVDRITLVDKVTEVVGVTNKVNVNTVDHITDITNEVDVINTDEYGWDVENTPQGEMRTVIPTRIAGSQFIGATVDTNFWTRVTGTGGSVTQASGLLTIGNGSTADNVASVTSVRSGRYISGHTNRFRGNFLMSAGATNVVRQFGAYDANDGYFFQMSGTAFNIVVRKAAGDTVIAQAAWDNPTGFTLDTNLHTYEIYWQNSSVKFSIDGVLVHSIKAGTAPMVGTQTFPIKMECKSINGGTTSKTLVAMNAAIHRLGPERTEAISKFISGANTGVALKLSAGRIRSISFIPGANGNSVAFYDSPTTTANQMGEIIGLANAGQFHGIDAPFFNGLWVVTTGNNSRCTIVYE